MSSAGRSLDQLFLDACGQCGDADFIIDPAVRLSGHQAAGLTRRAAAVIAAAGVGRGRVVAFLCRASAAHLVSWFGALAAGAVGCTLHARESVAGLADTLAWLDAALLVYDDDLHDLAMQIANGVPAIALGDARWGRGQAISGGAREAAAAVSSDLDALAAAADGPPGSATDLDALAAIVLSSGSTGRPKGAMHTHRTLIETARAGQQLYSGIGPRDSTLVTMAPSFAAWIHVVLPYVVVGAKVVFDPVFEPQRFLDTLARERITMAPAVPTMWRRVLALDVAAADLGALRVASISGEAPARSDLEALARICPTINALYLASEGGNAAGVFASTDTLIGRGKTAASGRSVNGAALRIVDSAGGIDALLGTSEVGEICLRGASLSVGYWRDQALTAQRFIDGWWRSGDLGRLDADGDLFVEGRIDNLINTGGMKVHAEEIERVLLTHPGVINAAVVGVPDPEWGQRIEAHVVPRDAALGADELIRHCRETASLARYKVPKAVHLCQELPLGPTGKLYRRALRSPQ